MKIKISEIQELCIKVLLKLGYNQKDSETILAEYLYGELAGKRSHGLASFIKMAEKANTKSGDIKLEKEGDAYALINANGGLGQLVGKFAIDLAIKKAKKTGIAIIGMHNMESYLMPGYYAKLAADQNMIGIVLDNSSSRVVPYGGIEPKLGTNPIGISFPTKEIPFILDMATSVRGMGEVRLATKLNESLPKDIALDKDGNATQDPNKVNALLPVGGYKGFGLAFAIEVLAGSFVRAKMGSKIHNGLDRGYLFLVIDPKIFVDIKTFKEESAELIKEVKSSKKAKGTEEIRIPGEMAQRTMKKNLEKGYIDVDDNILKDIKNLI